MTLTEISSFVNISTSNQLNPEQVSIIMDAVQKNVFQKNQQAFLVYDQKLTIQTELEFASWADAPTSADVGETITGDTSGATAVIVSYDAETLKMVVSSAGTFEGGEVTRTAGNTFVGTLGTENFQHGWRGPYSAPTDPDCRKIWGVTKKPPHLFWTQYVRQCGYWYSIDGIWQTQDYRAFWGDRLYPFVTGNTYDLSNEFLFSFDPVPGSQEEHPYYWVYWKNPPSITDLSDSSTLIIPEAYHLNFANAVAQVGKVFLEDGMKDIDAIVKSNLGGWIDTLLAPFRDQWRGMNGTQALTPGWV